MCPPEQIDCVETIVVTASRAAQLQEDATGAVRVLTRAEIERTGARNVADALRVVPGVDLVSTHGGTAVRIHGYDPRQVLVLIDGQPAIGRVDGTLDLERLAITDVDHLEIVEGAASALYGSDAMGGVINIVTRRTDGDSGWDADGSAQLGDRLTSELGGSVGMRRGPWEVRGALRRFGQQPWDDHPDDDATTADGVDGLATDVAVGWRRDHAEIRPRARYERRRLDGVDASATGAVFDRTTLEETAIARLDLSTGPLRSSSVALDAQVWRQQYLSDQRGSDVQDTYADTRITRLQMSPVQSWSPPRHLVVTGGDISTETMVSERLADGVASRQRAALYAQDDWRLSDAPKLSVASGARLDVDSQFGARATPRVAVRLDPMEALTVRASGGLGWRSPDYKELYLAFDHSAFGYVVQGNHELRPEASRGLTIDVAIRPAAGTELSAHGWCDRVDGLIGIELLEAGSDGSPARYTYQNVARARLCGVTPSVAYARGTWLTIVVAYTRLDAVDLLLDGPLDGRARDQGTLTASVSPVRRLTLSAQADHTGRKPFAGDGIAVWSEPYTWVDARAAWLVTDDLRFSVGVRNALGADDGGFSGLPPRTAWLGLSTTASSEDASPHDQGDRP